MKKLANICLVTFGVLLSTGVSFAQEQDQVSSPPLLEIGGSVSSFDAQTSTLVIDGKSFQVTTDTPMWVQGEDGAKPTSLRELSIPTGSKVFYEPLSDNRLRGLVIIPPSTKSAR